MEYFSNSESYSESDFESEAENVDEIDIVSIQLIS